MNRHIQFWGGPLNGWLREADDAPKKAIIQDDLHMPDGRDLAYVFRYIPVHVDEACVVMYLHDIQFADPLWKRH